MSELAAISKGVMEWDKNDIFKWNLISGFSVFPNKLSFLRYISGKIFPLTSSHQVLTSIVGVGNVI
jgi:hypothetical protein